MTRATSSMTARAGQRFEGRRLDRADVYLLSRQLQSEAIADMTARGARYLVRATGLSALFTGLAARLRKWARRRATIAQLSKLDNRTLWDIGVNPHGIEAAVDAMLNPANDQNRAHLGDVIRQIDTRTVSSLRHAGMAKPAKSPKRNAEADALSAELVARAANRNQDHTQEATKRPA
ncbi:DUF1127 domain-containing protein [Ferruginivarius sediminum]|uniref:DUF1127 domain-containing protein n=1 Tax=Ferruginivarius sediminum TaxID=2661937 RepID=A0A369TC87_9PROT|nr:DUF1127 domain-containing protein [Ferruginivarius sediminum]RDD62442.1 DUF1127 domain-containing protein [Ferruginivarius sediminum]